MQLKDDNASTVTPRVHFGALLSFITTTFFITTAVTLITTNFSGR